MRRCSLSPATRLAIALAVAPAACCRGAELVQKEGKVDFVKAGATPQPADVGLALVAHDKLGTAELSRAVLRIRKAWNARVDEETFVEITDTGLVATDPRILVIERGQAFVYSREPKGEWRILTPGGAARSSGTQLVVRVYPDGRTFVQVMEGEVDFGGLPLAAGEAGEAARGTAPRKTAALEMHQLLQWALYYPAVLQPDELGLDAVEQGRVAGSLEAYRQGDVLGALAKYPGAHVPASEAGKLYRAAVRLAAGQVDEARRTIESVSVDHPGRRALERMLGAVLQIDQPALAEPATASEAMAHSYYEQSRHRLEAALAAAKRATELAPQSGYTWTRLAELEFSFGHTSAARLASDKGLGLAPRNAQAHALQGFLLSAENRIDAARASFEKAIALDGALANGWLGLGLTKIKQGRRAAGQADLQTAVTVEPTRAFLYSYHAKAAGMAEDGALAEKDLARAKQIDAQDPTPWLYAAIQRQQQNRYNAAIGELQESLRRNDNRRVYRSQFLLDEDRAVRRSNLARIYQNNGMTDVAVREATRAVETDYTNASAHQFLADSFDALRDRRQILLRYETAWFNEQLLAYLLAPVGGGPLSQFVSQQEYSKLLDADGPGGGALTEWRDNGAFSAQVSLFATRGRWSGGLDYTYRRDHETRGNHDNAIKEASAQLKVQVTADDTAYALVQWRNQKNGDLLQNYANVAGSPGLRFEERQRPGLMLAGWNRRWAPGVHTLLLGGRLAAEQFLTVPEFVPSLILRDPAYLQPGFLRPGASGALEYASPALRDAAIPPVATNADGSLVLSPDFQRTLAPFVGRGPLTGIDLLTDRRGHLATQRTFALYSGEAQHLWQRRRNTLLLGGRWQGGRIGTQARLDLLNPDFVPFTTAPAVRQDVSVHFERRSLYAYDFFGVAPWLTLIAGGSWDRVQRPDNFRSPPVNDRVVKTERANGKVGFTLAPSRWATLRGVYTEALGGVSFDESVRLEPVQLAGFNQAFRTVISESLVGSVETPVYKNAGLSLEGALPTRTWWAATCNRLTEDVQRTVGALDVISAPIFPRGRAVVPGGTDERLAYREKVFTFGLSQLIGSEIAVGATYRFTRAELRDTLPQIPSATIPYADDYNRASLEDLALTANWNAPAGWFAGTRANWYSQDLHGTAGTQVKRTLPGAHFWQFDLQLGRRFQRNLREVSVGVLNLTNRDYHLSPLTYLRELERERTFFVRCRVGF